MPNKTFEILDGQTPCQQEELHIGVSTMPQPELNPDILPSTTRAESPKFPSFDEPELFWGHVHSISLNLARWLCREMTDSYSDEDIANSVIVRLYRNPATLQRIAEEQGSGNAGAYVATVTRNLVVDKFRRKNKIFIDSIDTQEHPLLNTLPAGPDQTKTFLEEDTIRTLNKTVQHEGHRAQINAIVLHHVMGYSIDETATILSCKPGTVKSRINRGITRLKELPEIQSLFQQHVMAQQ